VRGATREREGPRRDRNAFRAARYYQHAASPPARRVTLCGAPHRCTCHLRRLSPLAGHCPHPTSPTPSAWGRTISDRPEHDSPSNATKRHDLVIYSHHFGEPFHSQEI
jgi:hypothetical protein